MSETLNLVDRLLALARLMQALQRPQDALRFLDRLARLAELPPAAAEETRVRLATLYLQQKQYRRARRHLTIALLYRPESSRYHYLMARILSKGPQADLERAALHYQQALKTAPDQPRCLAGYGVCCLRRQRTEEGLAALMRALQLAPDDPAIVRRLVQGLVRAGRGREAQDVVRAARFRNPRDVRFEKLWNDFHYRQLMRRQARAGRTRSNGAAKDRPVLLPFSRSVPLPAGEGSASLRVDGPEALPGPHFQRPARRTDWLHG